MTINLVTLRTRGRHTPFLVPSYYLTHCSTHFEINLIGQTLQLKHSVENIVAEVTLHNIKVQ